MSKLCPFGKSKKRKTYAKAGAAAGSRLGASAGARAAPFVTGPSAAPRGPAGHPALAGSPADDALPARVGTSLYTR